MQEMIDTEESYVSDLDYVLVVWSLFLTWGRVTSASFVLELCG